MQDITPIEIAKLFIKKPTEDSIHWEIKYHSAAIEMTIDAIKTAALNGQRIFWFNDLEFESEKKQREENERKIDELKNRRRTFLERLFNYSDMSPIRMYLGSKSFKHSAERLGVFLYLRRQGFNIQGIEEGFPFIDLLDEPEVIKK